MENNKAETSSLALDDDFKLVDGAQIAVIGGGPAGSFFSYFVLDLAERFGLSIEVDIYEPRDFSTPAPKGCNMCGGIISETLVQNLAVDGINLPPTVVQRGIDSYMLHTELGKVRIQTPLEEKRIGAVYRGSGPRDIKEIKWGSFDGFLLDLTAQKGAQVINERVNNITIEKGFPVIETKAKGKKTYDLLTLATGVNSSLSRMFNNLEIDYTPPKTTKTFICEYYLGEDTVEKVLGSSMHVFLLDVPRLEFAAIIPKGDYATICMLGDDIDKELINSFLNSEAVKNTMPSDWEPKVHSCQCFPRINTKGTSIPFADRVVFIGDCGVTRLYKDGIGAAYRTAKAAASTVVFQGISYKEFEDHYLPACKRISLDNALGRVTFFMTKIIKGLTFARKGLVNLVADEQASEKRAKHMSTVMWDMFTGSASYKDIFVRTLHPELIFNFILQMGLSLLGIR
jgi:flavin-dependent dehydrogenase